MARQKVDIRVEEGLVEQIDMIADIEDMNRSDVMRHLMRVGFNVVTGSDPALIEQLDAEIGRLEERLEETRTRRDRLLRQIQNEMTEEP